MKRYPIIWTDRYGFGVTRYTQTISCDTIDSRYTGKSCQYRSRLYLRVFRLKIPVSRWEYTGHEFVTAWVKRTLYEEMGLARDAA